MENNIKQATNTIKYKFYSTEKPIPWLIYKNNIVPESSISDDWFNFVQLPTTKQFDFDDITTASIVAGKDTYTYWKVERYTNDVKDKTYYFYTNRVLKYLRNSFHLELKLDVYMTYTRNIFKDNVLNNHDFIKINRGSISKSMLLDSNMRNFLTGCMKNIDDNVLNGDDTYSKIDLFRFTDIDKNGQASNKFPINTNKLTMNYSKPVINEKGNSLFNFSSFKHEINVGNFVNYTKGAIQYYDEDSKTTKLTCNFNWLQFENNVGLWAFNDLQRNEVIKNYMKLFKLSDINPVDADEYNKNVMNGYYAVFRNLLGDIDCYPILGKLNARIELPFWVKAVGPLSSVTLPTPAESDKVITNKYFWNRIYADNNHADDFVLNNDWDSIYNDFLKNIVNTNVYSNKSFIGIYRGVVPTGKHNNICFDIEESNYRTGNVRVGNLEPVVGEWNIPKRMFYRISYNDFFTFTIGNDDLISGFKKFALDKNATNDLINDSFVELLQPITIGTTEIIPARYIFNIDNNELKYTIPYTGTFLDSFQLFLRNGMYNHASYSISLGGTLPTKNEDYENQIKVIEQQKNAGVYSSIGNIVARPINWLASSFGLGTSLMNQFSSTLVPSKQDLENNLTWREWANYESKKVTVPLSNTRFADTSSKGLSANIGGLGGFIGDGISIYNTIKQSNLAKRNVGPGYLTSMTEDLLNAVVHYDNVLDISENDKNLIKQGWFGIGFRKIFDLNTKMNYKFHFDNFGFPINSFVSKDYFKHLFNVLKTGDNKTIIYVSFDSDWITTALNDITTYNDNVIKELVVAQLSSGIRMKKFS